MDEVHKHDRKAVSIHGMKRAAGLDVPDADGVVKRAEDNEIGMVIEVLTEDKVRVTAEDTDALDVWRPRCGWCGHQTWSKHSGSQRTR